MPTTALTEMDKSQPVVSATQTHMDVNNTAHDGLVEIIKTLAGLATTAIVSLFGGMMWSNANKVSAKKYQEDWDKLQMQLAADRAQLALHNNELVGVKILLNSLKEHMDEGFKALREDLRHDRNN